LTKAARRGAVAARAGLRTARAAAGKTLQSLRRAGGKTLGKVAKRISGKTRHLRNKVRGSAHRLRGPKAHRIKGNSPTSKSGFGKYAERDRKIQQEIASEVRAPRRELYGSHGQPGRVDYGSIDRLTGNRSGTRARITRDMIGPSGPGTAASSSLKPPGFVSGLPPTRHARGHLHGNQLGGRGDVEENLVTLYQNPANHPNMSKIEGQVRRAVEEGEIVYYFTKPLHENGSGIPSGIRLRARGSGGLRIAITISNP